MDIVATMRYLGDGNLHGGGGDGDGDSHCHYCWLD